MAFAIKYYYQYYDIGGNLHRVEVLQDDYVGAVTPVQIGGGTPIVLRHSSSGKDSYEKEVILGQELVFTFQIPRADINNFEPIFESDYKTYKAKYYVEGTLEFEGYIKPENLVRNYVEDAPYVKLVISATDSLTDLKNYEYRDVNDDLYMGSFTLLEHIKQALDKIGLELDFYIQLGTYETNTMTSTDCALDKIGLDGSRFFKFNENGEEVKVNSCWDVLEKCIKVYNLKFKQYKGHYQLTNYHEVNSYEFVFDWATLTQQSRTATNNILDISTYKFFPYLEEQKLQPLNGVNVYFNDKEVGGDIVDSILDDWDTQWTIHFDSYSTDSDGTVTLNSNYFSSTGSGRSKRFYIELSSTFNLTKNTENDYIKLSFDYAVEEMISSFNPDAELRGNIAIAVMRPNGRWSPPVFLPLYGNYGAYVYNGYNIYRWLHFESANEDAFLITEDGAYNIRISFFSEPWRPNRLTSWTSGIFLVKNVIIPTLVEGMITKFRPDQVSFDSLYKQAGFDGIAELDDNIDIGDSDHGGPSAMYLYLTQTLTASWNSYGGSEGVRILDIYARNLINNRYRYKNYLKGTVVDRDNNIGFNNILQIDSRYYVILAFRKRSKIGHLELELLELLVSSQNYSNMLTPPSNQDIYLGHTEPFRYVVQSTHGFMKGDIVRLDGSDSSGAVRYTKALADNEENAKVVGLVSDVLTADLFKIISSGYLPAEDILDSGYTEGEYYYLSPDIPGEMLVDPIYASGDIEMQIGFTDGLDFKVQLGTLKSAVVEVYSWEVSVGGSLSYTIDDKEVLGIEGVNSVVSSFDVPTNSVQLELVNDASAPGNTYYYGTNSSGTKGWYEWIPIATGDVYYLHSETSDISGYVDLLEIAPDAIEQIDTANADSTSGEVLIQEFATDTGNPNTTALLSGGWLFKTYASVDSVTGTNEIVVRAYKRDSLGTETELFNDTFEVNQISVTLFSLISIQSGFSLDTTDRLVFKYYFKTTSATQRTISLYYEGSVNSSHIRTPISATPEITVQTDMSVTGDGSTASKITLVNDATSPGNYRYYGTNSSGTKGYFSFPYAGLEGVYVRTSDLKIMLNFSGLSTATPTTSDYIAFYDTGSSTHYKFQWGNMPFVKTSRKVDTQYSITGGGNLTVDRTLNLVGDVATPGLFMYYCTNGLGDRGWRVFMGASSEMSITGGGTSSSKFKLVNDATSPGNSYYYGTNSTGTKGWYTLALDHGSLTGLGDDDHIQYHNDARGDARYYTKINLQTSGEASVHWGNLAFVVSINTIYSLTGGGVLTSSRSLSLVNDATSPGNSYYYGTNSTGTKGWFSLPSSGSGLWTDATTYIYRDGPVAIGTPTMPSGGYDLYISGTAKFNLSTYFDSGFFIKADSGLYWNIQPTSGSSSDLIFQYSGVTYLRLKASQIEIPQGLKVSGDFNLPTGTSDSSFTSSGGNVYYNTATETIRVYSTIGLWRSLAYV